MHAAFEGADFSGLTPADVVIDDVIHDAVTRVFEGGTVAAAATAVTIKETAATVFDHTLHFDRPFFYVILDQPTSRADASRLPASSTSPMRCGCVRSRVT